MLEKRFSAVTPQALTANGTAEGKITVADTRLFKVKQKVFLQSSTQQPRDGLEVKKIINRTEMVVGPEKSAIHITSDVSDFLVTDTATVAANEQFRPIIPSEEFNRAVYEEEPTVAIRSMLVDKEGNDYRTENPLPVELSNGSVNIGTVNAELEVQLSHKDNFPDVGDVADSVRIGDGVHELAINSDGSINTLSTVTATDLDIRNLSHIQDSVKLGDGSDFLAINADGSINTNIEVNAADGDNIGLQVQQRTLTPSDNIYNKRVTAVTGSGPYADATSLDVSLHDAAGNAFTTANPLPINSTQIINALNLPLDFFGNQSMAIRTNQIEVQLDDINWTNYVDITTTLTGSWSQANGQVTISTGANINGRAAIISKDFVRYRPNSEVGWGFTWVFPQPSVANSIMRIGATDDINTWANSVYFSHENGVFSLVYRRGGVTIVNAQQSTWLDKCDGVSGSNYVDFSGTPVALDITKDQLARIRAGLFGHAGFIVELLAPNQTWVTIYKYTNINSVSVPIFATFDLKVGAEVKKTNDGASVLVLASACWAGWTGSSLSRVDEPISDRTLAQVTRTIIEGKTTAGGGNYVPVKVNPSGTLSISVGDIDGVKGQKTMANSMPVVIASDQTNVPIRENGAAVSTANSTSALLLANQTFTGASEDVLQYGVINVAVRSDVPSATDGLKFLFSADNTNFYSSDDYTILAGKFKTYSFAPVARYFKIQYTNGTSNQSQFLLQTIYKQVYVKPSSHRLQDDLSPQDDAEVVQSVMVAKLPSGNFQNVRTTVEGNLVTDFAQNQKDAFDRLITVDPTHLQSFDHRIDKHPQDFDEIITGSATSVHNANTVSVDMTTTTGATDSVVRQTYQAFEYTRGNTQQGLFSLNLNGGPKLNNNRYFGLGDRDNGAFIGVDGAGLYVMRRSKTSGIVVDIKIYQSNFNQDRLDGTGRSGVLLDLTKQNLFSILYSWLGTNAIVYSVAIGGIKNIFHIETVGNVIDTAWCQSGQLPLRFVNENTGITGSSTTFKVGCSSVFSYGSSKGFSTYQSVSTGTTAVNISATDTVIAGIRLRPNIKYVSIQPADYQILPTSGTAFGYYKIIFRPTLVGATWADYGNIGQVLTNTPTFTGGIVIQEGYFNLSTTGRVLTSFPATLETILGYSIANVPDSLIIVMRTTTGNGSVLFSGTYKEIY